MQSAGSPGERLRIFRRALGLSGAALAKGIGRSKGIVSYWEAGRSPLPLAVCLSLDALYGVSANWLLEGIGPMWAQPKESMPPDLPIDLMLIPVLPVDAAFDRTGMPMTPPPDVERVGLPRGILGADCPGNPDSLDRLWVRVSETQMEETIGHQAWALLDTSEAGRREMVDHALYLVRLADQPIPRVRRLRTDPQSGDLIVATEAKGQVPMRIELSPETLTQTILGKVLWVLRRTP